MRRVQCPLASQASEARGFMWMQGVEGGGGGILKLKNAIGGDEEMLKLKNAIGGMRRC